MSPCTSSLKCRALRKKEILSLWSPCATALCICTRPLQGWRTPTDGWEGLSKASQCTSKSSRASLSIAIILGESVSQLLAMEKSCGSQQRVCFSEKSGMMGGFFFPLVPKKDALTIECKARTCPKGDEEHRGHKMLIYQSHLHNYWIFFLNYWEASSSSSSFTTYSESTGIETQPPSFQRVRGHCGGQGRNRLWHAVRLTHCPFVLSFVPFLCPLRLRKLAGMWQEVLDKSERDRQTETGCTARLAA